MIIIKNKMQRHAAKLCWQYASKLIEFSPAARILAGKITKGKLRRWIARTAVIVTCELLLYSDDTETKYMVIKAMNCINYRSLNIGKISGWLYNERADSRQKTIIDYQTKFTLEVYRYLQHVLDLRELHFFDKINEKISHWERVLSIDYSKDYRTKNILQSVELSDQEVKEKIRANKLETYALFQQDICEYVQKVQALGYMKKEIQQVYNSLRKILYYCFCQASSPEEIDIILANLNRYAIYGNYPHSWLLELTNDIIKKHNLSPSLNKLLVKI
jgi:hypothetical protein